MLKSLRLFNGNNAVQTAQMQLLFSGEIEAKSNVAAFDDLKKRVYKDFGNRDPIQAMRFEVGPGGMTRNEGIVGYQFYSKRDTGNLTLDPALQLSKVMSIKEQEFLVVDNRYESWTSFRGLIDRSMRAAQDLIFSSRALVGVQLSYVDQFIWRDDPKKLTADMIFEAGPFVPSNAFTTGSQYWHSHHGFFRENDEIEGTWLDNINVARSRQEFDVVTVNCTHKVEPPEAIWDAEASLEFIGRAIDLQHSRNKEILRSLLKGEVLKLTGLS